MGNEVIASVPIDDEADHVVYHEPEYQAAFWKDHYRVVMRSECTAGELLWTHTFLVTNMVESLATCYSQPIGAAVTLKTTPKNSRAASVLIKPIVQPLCAILLRRWSAVLPIGWSSCSKCVWYPKIRASRLTLCGSTYSHITGRVTRHAGEVCLHLASNYGIRNWFGFVRT